MVKLARALVAFSKDLRGKQTQWESILWEHLRANNFGIKFKQQVVIGPYIFDFAAKRHKLLIEVDGFWHKNKGKFKDRRKVEFALKSGYKVLKVWNSEIEKDLAKVLDKIYSMI